MNRSRLLQSLRGIPILVNKKTLSSVVLMVGLAATTAQANICGTDFQNFNPTTSGLDFVTVHSSETLKPCIMNFGLFLNYAANTLSYSQNYNGLTSGTKANDRILGGDMSLGFGITENWDVGFNIPVILSQELSDNQGVTYFDKKGATELKFGTKYRFTGDDQGGIAGIFSINNNLIQHNPFMGEGAGPTMNFELAFDTTFERKWAAAINVGYRKRSPGDVIPNQPFLPLKDQFTYSAAASYLLQDYSIKLIGEIFGAVATKKVDYDSDRSLNALEGLVGIKQDISQSVAWHIGGGTKLGDAIGSPNWRIYTGVNWAIGPICAEDQAIERIEIIPIKNYSREPIVSETLENPVPESYRVDVNLLFDTNSDKIKATQIPEIDRFIADVQKKGFKKIDITGHTDSIGSAEHNLDLSRRRADSVKRYVLQKFKIAPNLIGTEGKGESEPISDNGNYQGRRKNRRVEFKIWK